MYFDDKDFGQKCRFQKVLWAMGYWSRVEIPVVIYEDDNKSEKLQRHYLTDIDVYGEIIQPDFSVTKSIGDCKSGKNVKIFERLFWVRGIKDYLNAEHAYLIKRSISPNAKIFMPKVDVKGIDDQALTEMENIFHSLHLNLFSEEYYRFRTEIINQLVDEYKKIYDYMNTRYWFTDLNISLKVLMTMLKKRDFYNTFMPNDKTHCFLLLEICIMLSRALLDCCKYVMSRDVTNIQMSVIEYIHGGVNGYNNKMQMMREISTPIKEILGTEEVANKVLVVPEYFEDLVKIIVILIGESSYIKDVTRYIEIMQHEVLLEKSIEYTQIIGLEYSSVAHKIAKDIIIFYLKTNRIDIHFFDKLFLR
ncbi:hypothetical protein AALB51_17845 [Lachnospiraceae bacterium 62-26]